jgi:hypothetical protein
MKTEQATEIDWDQILRQEMDWAIEQKRKVTGDDEFTMRVKVVGPYGQIANTPVVWRNEQEKRKAMWAVSQTAKMTVSQAVIVTSDARFLNVPGFCKRFGIAEPTPGNLEAFDLERRRVMKGFDFYMGNLPRDCFDENLLVAIRGPRVCRMAIAKYTVVKGVVVFEPTMEDKDAKVIVNMVPEWWQ